jgi:hypothetical protein
MMYLSNIPPTPKKALSDMVVITTASSSAEEVEPDVSVEKLQEIFEKLNAIYQGMTFKELGVISSTEKAYRPTTTKLFNLVNRIVYLPDHGIEPHGLTPDDSSVMLLALMKKNTNSTKADKAFALNGIKLPKSGPKRGLPEIDESLLR